MGRRLALQKNTPTPSKTARIPAVTPTAIPTTLNVLDLGEPEEGGPVTPVELVAGGGRSVNKAEAALVTIEPADSTTLEQIESKLTACV